MQRTLIQTESKTQNAIKLDKAFCTIEGVRPVKKISNTKAHLLEINL